MSFFVCTDEIENVTTYLNLDKVVRIRKYEEDGYDYDSEVIYCLAIYMDFTENGLRWRFKNKSQRDELFDEFTKEIIKKTINIL